MDDDIRNVPSPRSGHCMCADQNFVYIFGGYNPLSPEKTFRDLWYYNTSTEQWNMLPDEGDNAPRASLSSSMVLLNNVILIFGGCSYPFASTNSNELHAYSLTQKQWLNVGNMETKRDLCKIPKNHVIHEDCGCKFVYDKHPTEKYGQSVIGMPDHRLYVFSGTLGQKFVDELHSFCLKTLTWMEHQLCLQHRCEGHIEARYKHEVIDFDTKIGIFGGATIQHYMGFENIESFDIITNRWEITQCESLQKNNKGKSIFPKGRKAHSCVKWNGCVYMFGGTCQQSTHMDDYWMFDIKHCCWNKLKKSLPLRPLSFHSAAVTKEGCMYIFGGITNNEKRVNDLTPVWLNVPPLKRLAWMKVVKELHKSNRLDKETLRQLRIPKEYVDFLSS